MTTADRMDTLLVEKFAVKPVTAHGAHYLAVAISTTLNQESAQRTVAATINRANQAICIAWYP